MDKKTKSIRPNNISEIYDINLALLRKLDYNEIEKGEYGELNKLLYFLVNNDKEILDSLYGEDRLMEDIKKKIEQVTNDLDYLFYYDRKELEQMRDERERREGREEGLKEGREEGRKEANIETAIKLLELKVSDNIILESTKLSKEELNELKKNI